MWYNACRFTILFIRLYDNWTWKNNCRSTSITEVVGLLILFRYYFRATNIPIIIQQYLPDKSHKDWAIDEFIITEYNCIGSSLVLLCYFYVHKLKFFIFLFFFTSPMRVLYICKVLYQGYTQVESDKIFWEKKKFLCNHVHPIFC